MASTSRLFINFFAYLLILNSNVIECLNVTCHNQIGAHPFRRMNTCYIKRIERPLQRDEELVFLQSYGSAKRIKTLDISILNDDQPHINHIPTEAFAWFPHLESLRVNSMVSSISSTDLKPSSNLTELVISNQLETIQRGIFPSENLLTFLSFECNRISLIEDFAFEKLDRLFSLKLQSNQMEEIHRHTFTGLGSLHVLNLSQNKIRVIEKGAFDGLNELQLLHMQQNQIESLFDDIFYGLGNLIDISLSKNRIHHINKSLRTLTQIKKIDLDYNQILDLDLHEFAKFPTLIDLRLINSGFKFNNFQNNDQITNTSSILEYLYLDNNNLSNPLDLQALGMFDKLRQLSLDDNLYEDFDLGGKKIKEILPNLQFLSLEGNDIDQSVLSTIKDELNPETSSINPM